MKFLEYRGYTGSLEYSPEDNLLFGQVLGIQSLISYEGETGKLLEQDFRLAIDNYLEDCSEKKIDPEKPFKGNFNVRIPGELHRKASLLAIRSQSTLNRFVEEAIRKKVQESD